MSDYDEISEIIPDKNGDPVSPLVEWDIKVIARGLSENFGDIGGREDFVANARVRVTEPDGNTWTGFTRISE